MRIKRKKNNNNLYLIVIFVSICFFCSIGFSAIQSILIDNKSNGISNQKQSIPCSLENKEKLSSKEFIESIEEIDKVYIQKSDLIYKQYFGSAIYFNYKNDYHTNIISGRFFERDDFLKDEPKVVIGKDMIEDTVIDKDDNKYFEYDGLKYKVIGIMGYEDRKSPYDTQFVINFDSYIYNKDILHDVNSMIVNNEENFDILNKNVKSKNSGVKLVRDTEIRAFLNTSIDMDTVIKVLAVICVLIFLNVFNITIQWVSNKKKQIGIKKALGAPNFKIAFEIIIENQKIAIISFLIGYVLYAIVIKSGILSVLGANLYIISSLVTLLFSMIISLITSSIAIRRSIKIEPAIIMKGAKR